MTLLNAFQQFIEWRKLNRKSSTINGNISHLAHFCLFMNDIEMNVDKITFDDCIKWLKVTRLLGFDENTLQKKAIAIKLFFQFLKDSNVPIQVEPNLIPIPEKNFKLPKVATEEQYQKLLQFIPIDSNAYQNSRNRTLLMMLHDSGVRSGEIVSLDMENLNLKKQSAEIKTEKSRGIIPFREIFWTRKTNEQLKDWLKQRKIILEKYNIEEKNMPAVFIGIRKGQVKRLESQSVSDILLKYSRRAGLETTINPHSLRHLFGRDMAKKNANNYVIASMMGHSKIESSYPYTMLFGRDREKMYRRLRGN